MQQQNKTRKSEKNSSGSGRCQNSRGFKLHHMTCWYNYQEKPKPQQSQSCPVEEVLWYVWYSTRQQNSESFGVVHSGKDTVSASL